MRSDLFFFLGIFLFIFVVWVGTGGPSRPVSWAGPFLSPPSPLGSGQAYFLPNAHFQIGTAIGGGSSGDVQNSINQTQDEVDRLKQQAAEAIAFGEPSPYRGIITFDRYVSGPTQTDARSESVTLRLSSRAVSKISISGWKLLSAPTGAFALIPQGTEVPRSGIVNASEPIFLSPGSQAIITSGRSPIGASFRENLCIGYFGQYQTFSPSLPNTCPLPEDEFDRWYGNPDSNDTCRAFVKAIPRCTMVTGIPPALSSCAPFVTNYLNYNGCVLAHQSERGFLGDTWRVFLGRDTGLWKAKYETIKLLDADGKTVDSWSY